MSPCCAVDPRAGEREAFHREARALGVRARASRSSAGGRTAPGWKRRAASGARTTTSTIFGVRRSTSCTVARSSSFSCARKSASGSPEAGSTSREHAAHDGIALLGRCHRLHDVAEERRVHVAEIAHAAAVRRAASSSTRTSFGFEIAFSGRTGLPASSTAWKYRPSSAKCAGVLAREHRVGLRAGRDEDRAARAARPRRPRPTCRRRCALCTDTSSARAWP